MENCEEDLSADQTLIFNESQDSIVMNQTDPLMTTVIEKTNPSGGSDSGLEGCWNNEPLPTLTRSLHISRGPGSVGGYSSCATVSCDSSLLSCCCDDSEEVLTNNTTVQRFGDGTSEGGSESSSIRGEVGSRRRSTTGTKRRPETYSNPRTNNNTCGTRSRPGRSSSATPKPSSTSIFSTSKKFQTSTSTKTSHSSSKPVGKTQNRAPSTTRTRISPSGITAATASSKAKEKEPPSLETSHKSRTPSLSRANARLDDGRWPSTIKPAPRKAASAACSSASTPTTMEHKSSAIEKFATLPRRQTRRAKSPPSSSSNSNTNSTVVSHPRSTSVNRNSRKTSTITPKTRIFHETCVQTSLTTSDLDSILSGKLVRITDLGDVLRTQDQFVQVDRRHEEIDKLLVQIKQLSEGRERLQFELNEIRKELETERAEKAAIKEELDRTAIRVFAMLGTDGESGSSRCEDSLQELESQMHSSSHIVTQQQRHISKLEALCRTLQRDLEKSLAAQKTLLQQQQDMEVESLELKEFLQAEKATLHEALREAEQEADAQKAVVVRDAAELERRGHECKHLVRVSEQRRQENLALEARLTALERRSRELLLQQGAALSGAALSLAGLGSRLDALVEQLVQSYDISEKDLEDVIFHNEAYSKSSSSAEGSPEKSRSVSNSTNDGANAAGGSANGSGAVNSSPKRGGSASFVSAVINAIRNATTIASRPNTDTATPATPAPSAVATAVVPAGVTVDLDTDISPKDDTDLTLDSDLLECEAAPCLDTDEAWTGLDNGLDLDDSTSISPSSELVHSRSLLNLSQAIVQRQQAELLTQSSEFGGDGDNENGTGEGGGSSSDDLCTLSCRSLDDGASLPPLHNCASAATLVDQVIDVDNLVTRLLKILRIIQLDNDQRLEEVEQERDILNEQKKLEESAKISAEFILKERENLVQSLRQELDDSRAQLNARIHELDEARDAAESFKIEKNRLSREFQILEIQLQEQTKLVNNSENIDELLTISEQVPSLKVQLQDKEKQLTEMGTKYLESQNMLKESWKQAANEVKRQYEVIDTALETLQNVQDVVSKCPPLAKMQEQLEECNFQSASSMPLVCADLNANAAVLTPNGTHNGLTLADNTLSVVTTSTSAPKQGTPPHSVNG